MKQILIKQRRKKQMCTCIALVLLLIVFAAPVFAAENNTGEPSAEGTDNSGEAMSVENAPEEGTILPSITRNILESVGEDDSEEMFAEYVDRLFSIEDPDFSSGGRKKAKKNVGSKFTGASQIIYSQLYSGTQEIAAGQRESSVFVFSVEELGFGLDDSWNAADLGVSAVVVDNAISDEAADAAMDLADNELQITEIMSALLADCPYELYWHDKVVGINRQANIGAIYTNGEWRVYLTGDYTVSLAVAEEFAVSQYAADTGKTGAASQAVENANIILTENHSLSDIEKLNAYKSAICGAVSYNDEAAQDEGAYGNPWQLIWVFDGDDTTNVVCEGYSKAFQYLCDKTDFSHEDICAYSVSGNMTVGTNEGPHMWNIVTLDDGYNYLADVTNSDNGSVGQSGNLFLVPYTSGSVEDGYTFSCGDSTNALYIYDDNMVKLFSAKDLTIAAGAYGTNPEIASLEITLQPRPVSAVLGELVSLQVAANKDNVSYQWQWSTDGDSWIDCTSTGYDTDIFSFQMKENISGRLYRCVVSSGDETVYSDGAKITLDSSVSVMRNGVLGDHITWTLDIQGNLVLYGYGPMYDYTLGESPLKTLSDVIWHVSISDGITSIGNCVFFNQNGIKENISIPDSVTSIGDYAFSECSATGFSLPDGLISIGDYAFKQSIYFENLSIPDSVQEIGNHAFDYCLGLKSININGKVSAISEGLFIDCGSLTTVEFPETVASIGSEAFKGCYSLKNLSLPNSIVSIGEYAFAGCDLSNLTDLPQNLTSIGAYAFCNTHVSEITIPDEVTVIPDYAFNGANVLWKVNLPDNLANIGEHAFSNCDELHTLRIPRNVSIIGDDVFPETCTLFVEKESSAESWALTNNHLYIVISDDSTQVMAEGTCGVNAEWQLYWNGQLIISGNGPVTNVDFEKYRSNITNVEIGANISELPGNAFINCPYLEKIKVSENSQYFLSVDDILYSKDMTILYKCPRAKSGVYCIPDEVTTIDYGAFYGCNNLTSIIFPQGLETIEATTFVHCNGLTSVEIPDSVTKIDASAFQYCENIREITLSKNINSIESGVFEGCSSLVNIDIPDNITSIGYGAFRDCSSLTEITLPQTISYIGDAAFCGCSELIEISIPEGIEILYPDTFRDCGNLTAITLPSSLTCIKETVFMNCTSLQSIEIPPNVRSIGMYTFSDCHSLESVVLPEGLTEIAEGTFWKCKQLKRITLPQNLTSLSAMSFTGCSSLKNLDLPSGLVSIGHSCFSDCVSLEEITIPDSVTSDAGGLFLFCTSLKTVHLPDGWTQIPNEMFYGCYSLTKVNIPDAVTQIGTYAFSHCFNLENIELPSGVDFIGDEAFNSCRSLKNINIPDSVDTIGYCCFYRCFSLENIHLPANLKLIKGWAFNECSNLNRIIIPDGTEEICERAFQNCTSLEKIYIPESVTSMEPAVFAGTYGVKAYGKAGSLALEYAEDSGFTVMPLMNDPDFVLPNDLKIIEEEAFSEIKASVVKLPDSVDTIGAKAFSNCANLAQIYIPETTDTISEDAFLNVSDLIIYGREDSNAAVFASDYGYTFIDTSWLSE